MPEMVDPSQQPSLAFGAGAGKFKLTRTSPESIDRHDISDEVEKLSDLRKDNVVEIFWGRFGALLGSITPAIQLLDRLGNKETPLVAVDLAVLLIAGIAGAMTIIMGIFWIQRSKKASDLVTTIRNRPKQTYGDAAE